MYSTYAQYGEARVKLTWVPSRELPPITEITSVHGLCFWEGKLVLVELKRGIDIPGGHLEPPETPEECFRREAMEEAYVRGGACTLLGHVIVDHSENPAWTPDGPYPKVGYQVNYRMDVAEVLPFAAEFESARRLFVAPEELSPELHRWNELRQLILNEALAVGVA